MRIQTVNIYLMHYIWSHRYWERQQHNTKQRHGQRNIRSTVVISDTFKNSSVKKFRKCLTGWKSRDKKNILSYCDEYVAFTVISHIYRAPLHHAQEQYKSSCHSKSWSIMQERRSASYTSCNNIRTKTVLLQSPSSALPITLSVLQTRMQIITICFPNISNWWMA